MLLTTDLGLARLSLLVVAVLMCSTGCLLTSSPQFEETSQTAPFLVPSTAQPAPQFFVEIGAQGGTLEPKVFSAEVRSEDVGEPVLVRLFIDYGDTDSFGKPFADSESFSPLPPSTLTNPEPRIARATLPATYWNGKAGCHTVTMMVTHAFNETTGCPAELSDSSQLTWYVYACEAGAACPPEGASSVDCLSDGSEERLVCPESSGVEGEAVQ